MSSVDIVNCRNRNRLTICVAHPLGLQSSTRKMSDRKYALFVTTDFLPRFFCGTDWTLANLLQIFFAVSKTFDLDAFSMWGQICVSSMGLKSVLSHRNCLLVKLNLVHLPYARPYMLNEQRAFVGTVGEHNPRMQKARPGAHT